MTFLGSLVSEDIPITSLLTKFQPLVILLHSLSKKIPQIFLNLASKQLEHEEDCVLAVWTRESPHNYENNSKITEVLWSHGSHMIIMWSIYRSLCVQALTNLLWSLTADVVQREGYIQLDKVSSNICVLSPDTTIFSSLMSQVKRRPLMMCMAQIIGLQ